MRTVAGTPSTGMDHHVLNPIPLTGFGDFKKQTNFSESLKSRVENEAIFNSQR